MDQEDSSNELSARDKVINGASDIGVGIHEISIELRERARQLPWWAHYVIVIALFSLVEESLVNLYEAFISAISSLNTSPLITIQTVESWFPSNPPGGLSLVAWLWILTIFVGLNSFTHAGPNRSELDKLEERVSELENQIGGQEASSQIEGNENDE